MYSNFQVGKTCFRYIYIFFYLFYVFFLVLSSRIKHPNDVLRFLYIFLISSYGAVRQSCLNDVSHFRIYFFFTNRAVLVISKLVGFTSDEVCFNLLVYYILGGIQVFFQARQFMVKYALSFFFFN